MSRDSYSKEVMVRLFYSEDEGIFDVETFCYELNGDHRDGKLTNAEWVQEHIDSCVTAADIKEWCNAEEPGVYQILMKVKLHGYWSGWETEEYDEELDILEYWMDKMADDWLDWKLKLDKGLEIDGFNFDLG